MRKMKIKVIFSEDFLCPRCGRHKILEIDGICIDCRDEQTILELGHNLLNKLATSTQ